MSGSPNARFDGVSASGNFAQQFRGAVFESVVDVHFFRGHVQIPFFVGAQAVGHAGDFIHHDAFFRRDAFAVEIVGAHAAVIGIRNVERAAVGGERDAVGARLPFRDDFQFAFGRDVVDAVEIQLAGILLRSERGVREINMPIAPHHDVVGRVESLAFEARRQHFDLAVLQSAGYAAFAEFAGVEAALRVVGVADGAAGAFGENGIRRSRGLA